MPLLGWLRTSDPLLMVVAALLAAAGLVVYLQDQALRTLQAQREVILQAIAERHAKTAAETIQRTFEAPLVDTISAVNHPLLRDGRLDLVAEQYAIGLTRFPQIDRFVLWTDGTERDVPGETLFFDRRHAADDGGQSLDAFYRDPALGRAILDLARHHAAAQLVYVAAERTLNGRPLHVLLRLFWVDARRDRYFAVLGYIVDLQAIRTRVLGELYQRQLASLTAAAGAPAFALQVLDETGKVVFGDAEPHPPLAGRAPFPFRFYPGDLLVGRFAVETPPRAWQVQASPIAEAAASPLTALLGPYWLTGLSLLLMAVALGFVVSGQRRAAELSRMQATFIAHVSHQLKTPLALLHTACESLTIERVRTPAKLAQYLAIMRGETERLTTLVERVLEFSRLEQGRRAYDVEAVDLGALVQETAEAFTRTLTAQGFTFRVEVEGAVWVRADPAALEQVLVNLLDNAAKYSVGQRGITIRAAAHGDHAFFEVADRGIGIDAADLPRIFDHFYRGARATLDRRGFGLGLAIAREIVRAHYGRIEVDSRVGRGTTFRVTLARLRADRLPRATGARLPNPDTPAHATARTL